MKFGLETRDTKKRSSAKFQELRTFRTFWPSARIPRLPVTTPLADAVLPMAPDPAGTSIWAGGRRAAGQASHGACR
jgi:hypothetical protein